MILFLIKGHNKRTVWFVMILKAHSCYDLCRQVSVALSTSRSLLQASGNFTKSGWQLYIQPVTSWTSGHPEHHQVDRGAPPRPAPARPGSHTASCCPPPPRTAFCVETASFGILWNNVEHSNYKLPIFCGLKTMHLERNCGGNCNGTAVAIYLCTDRCWKTNTSIKSLIPHLR